MRVNFIIAVAIQKMRSEWNQNNFVVELIGLRGRLDMSDEKKGGRIKNNP